MALVRDSGTETPQRWLWADNLRVGVVAGVIMVHAALAYVVDIANWYYIHERTTSGAWSTVLVVPAVFGAIFALAPLFLIAGWFAARSVAHRGPAGFATSRLVRLGVPTVVYIMLINPLTDYLGNLLDESRSFAYYLRRTEVGVMWFAAALLTFSLAYALWVRLRPSTPAPHPLSAAVLVAAGVTLAASSFAVWLIWPVGSTVFLNLRIYGWPQGAVLFALGAHAANAGWLEDLAHRLDRRVGWVAAACTLALAVWGLANPGGTDKPLAMTSVWATLVVAVLYAAISVTFSLWVVAWFQRRWAGHGPLVDKASRASFATYFIHPPVLTLIMLIFAPLPLEAGFKFVVVAVVAVPLCFIVGYLLTRAPGISKVF